MRSEQVYRAMEQGRSRFEICQLVFKSVRLLHKPGLRFQDTINSTLVHMGSVAVPGAVIAGPAARFVAAA